MLTCLFFFFYSEEVCILSASGTAAVLNPRFLQDGTVEGSLEQRLSWQRGLFSIRAEKGERLTVFSLRAGIVLCEGGLQCYSVEIRTRHFTEFYLREQQRNIGICIIIIDVLDKWHVWLPTEEFQGYIFSFVTL